MAATGNEVPLLSQLKQFKNWVSSQLDRKLSSDSLNINGGILSVDSGGTGGDNKTDARHGIGMIDLLWSGSVSIRGNTDPPAMTVTGISNYYVIMVSFSGRSSPCILSRYGQSNWFYGDSSYTAGNASETIYTLGICLNTTGGDHDSIVELRCCSHVIGAEGAVGNGNDTATIVNIYGVA